MLPDVGSMIVPPGLSSPSRSAASIMATAGRSLTLPPGLKNSSLRATVARMSWPVVSSRTRGVLPIRSSSESAIWGRSGSDAASSPPMVSMPGRRYRVGGAGATTTAGLTVSLSVSSYRT